MASMPPWLEDLLTRAWSPSLPVIIITFLIAVSLPIVVHSILYRARAPKQLPTFLLVGPSGAGKTSLSTLLESQTAALPTHLSQSPSTVQTSLPPTTRAASAKYRSEHDYATQQRPQLLVTDTPGHGKLRHHALSHLRTPPPSLKGLIFVIDSSALSSDVPGQSAPGLEEAARYLHDVLLLLQQRYTRSKTSKGPGELPVLIAANKLDLFTSLPPHLVQSTLEAEITRIRSTRAKGLLGSDVGGDALEDEKEMLGQGGEGKFDFGQMEEVNVHVTVKGGNVTGSEGPDIDSWWAWIGEQL